QSAGKHEQEAWIRLGMELLDESEKEILVLRQWEGLSFKEIGERLNIKHNTARMRNERALAHLAEKVGTLRRGEWGKDD
ncbi:MAG: sigma-70 family RNA polymerase sigma factor, partial [Planctomycetota bacterium]